MHPPLRPFQIEALQALQKPQHVLCIAPTGSGKSRIYEEIAATGHYRMLLITPLVALARQQEAHLKSLGIPVTLGSSAERKKSWDKKRPGAWILSPETLDYPSQQQALLRFSPNILVVDECHCLWEWGEQFRPAFRRIPGLLQDHQIERSLWLTATLPPAARDDLRALMPKNWTELGRFNLPPNLFLEVSRIGWPERTEYLLERVRQSQGSGIVFVSTREASVRLQRILNAIGKKTTSYHAGMSHEERRLIEKKLTHEEIEIVVATSAFGMGMNYSQLKWVILWQAPTSILSLTQAIGRVGRCSNTQARALIIWDEDDFKLNEWVCSTSQRKKHELQAVQIFLNTESCRTSGLRQYFNHEQESLHCQQCNYCEPLFA